MPRRKKVDDLPDFEKDSVTQAVINTNGKAFESRREQMAKVAEKDARIDRLENDIAELKKLVKGLTK